MIMRILIRTFCIHVSRNIAVLYALQRLRSSQCGGKASLFFDINIDLLGLIAKPGHKMQASAMGILSLVYPWLKGCVSHTQSLSNCWLNKTYIYLGQRNLYSIGYEYHSLRDVLLVTLKYTVIFNNAACRNKRKRKNKVKIKIGG